VVILARHEVVWFSAVHLSPRSAQPECDLPNPTAIFMTSYDRSVFLAASTLAVWTMLVLCLLAVVRGLAGRRSGVVLEDFRYGESSAIPPWAVLVNRNYMNLLELPVLFYAVCVLLVMAQANSEWTADLSWGYAFFRFAHSLVHMTYNRVLHRIVLFSISNCILFALWMFLIARIVS
jgi:hypothetical protein